MTMWIVATAVVLAAGSAIVAYWLGALGGSPTRPESAPPLRTAERADSIRSLLQPLIDTPDWSDARLLAVNHALLEAGRTRIAAEANEDWFAAFVDTVRGRVKEQQALAGAPLSPDHSPLAALASTLGIDLSSPDRPIHIVPEPGERTAAGATGEGSKASAREASRNAGAAASTANASAAPTRNASQPSGAPVLASSGKRAASQAAPLSASGGAAARASAHGSGNAAAAGATAAAHGAVAADQASASQAVQATTAANPGMPKCSEELSHARRNYCQDMLASGAAGPLLAVIPSGSFQMGNAEVAEERPAHLVTLGRPFAMSVNEVSQGEYQTYCRASGHACAAQPWQGDDYPVVDVDWDDARAYAHWLSQSTGAVYRLPTEAEWEYAARAGQAGLYPSGTSLSPTDAYFSSGGVTLSAPARRSQRFNANAWRLLHMVGNVREWVQDAWSPSFAGAPTDGSAMQQGAAGTRVVRGGSYADGPLKLRLTTREPLAATTRDRVTGIRLVREIR